MLIDVLDNGIRRIQDHHSSHNHTRFYFMHSESKFLFTVFLLFFHPIILVF